MSRTIFFFIKILARASAAGECELDSTRRQVTRLTASTKMWPTMGVEVGVKGRPVPGPGKPAATEPRPARLQGTLSQYFRRIPRPVRGEAPSVHPRAARQHQHQLQCRAARQHSHQVSHKAMSSMLWRVATLALLRCSSCLSIVETLAPTVLDSRVCVGKRW
jgi:hypothetical protein